MASNGKKWVLLAAGSKGWENYRHQADVCHAYQVAHDNGIPEEQIVVMMYDDIAYNSENPYPGKIINIPNGPNVYQGVPKDYTGKDVSAANFLAVLQGCPTSSNRKHEPKKVIRSGKNDSIFIYLSDHGGHGVFQFPDSTLYAYDLIDAVRGMSKDGKFAQMVIYMESCHAGSMLEELPKLGKVYAVAACKPDESSYACFFDEKRNAFLADTFTAYWLHHTKKKNLATTTFDKQFHYLKEKVKHTVKNSGLPQTPCHYGNKFMLPSTLSEFLGAAPSSIRKVYKLKAWNFHVANLVPSKNVPMIIQENRIKKEKDSGKREALERQYQNITRKRSEMDKAIQGIAQRCCPDECLRLLHDVQEVTRMYELKIVAEHFRTTLFNWDEEQFVFNISHLQVLVNLCEYGLGVESITAAITGVKGEFMS